MPMLVHAPALGTCSLGMLFVLNLSLPFSKYLEMASPVVQSITSSLAMRATKPLYSTEQSVTMEAEGLITRIRTVMSRYYTNRDAVENAETLEEIKVVLGGLRMSSLDLSEDEATAVIVPEMKPVNAAEEARW
jgi:hypothetical protein